MKRLVYIFVTIIIVLSLCGCGDLAEKNPLTTVTINKNGSITFRIHESFTEEEHCDIAELKEMILDEAANYNVFNLDAISLDKIEVTDGITNVQMNFSTAEDYQNYTKEKLYVGKCSDAYEKGKVSKVILSDTSDSSNTISDSDIKLNEDDNILITECKEIIYLPSKVLYISDNCEVLEDGRAIRNINSDKSVIYVIY